TIFAEIVKLLNFGVVVSENTQVRPFEGPAPGFVTVTVTDPGAWAGVVSVSAVAPQLVTTAFVPPKETVGKVGLHTIPEPAMLAVSPPFELPDEAPVAALVIVVIVAAPVLTPVLASWK